MRFMAKYILIFAILYLTTRISNCLTNDKLSMKPKYQILLLTPMGSRSHKNFFMGIAKALSSQGHKITIVSTFKEAAEIPNIRDIVITGSNINDILTDPFTAGSTTVMNDIITKFPKKCIRNLGAKEVQDLKKENFDFVMISMTITECFLSLVYHFKVPYAYVNTMTLSGVMQELAGSIYFDSLAPNILLGASFPTTFFVRLKSTLLTYLVSTLYKYYNFHSVAHYCKKTNFCNDMPNIEELIGTNSLVIMNSVRGLERPAQPWLPHVIHAGGIHCRPAKPLPKDIEDWIEDSGKEGFIFFSLGSSVHPSHMPEKYKKIFLNAFASVKFRVLWKWDEEFIDDLPPNVKISKWLPQQDILGHPNIHLFITHGGLLSTQEATYHNCPILGIPLFADQFTNVLHVVNEGWGDQISLSELTEELLISKILSITNNTRMKDIAQNRSIIMKDRLNEPADEVVYWVEYVIRHNGAEHMKSPFPKLYWYEIYNVDVWLTLIVISVFILLLLMTLLKCIIFRIFRGKFKKD